MGKQYISTVSAAQAHKLDILGVAMTGKYTITVSSDGYAAFWDNKKDEVHQPLEFVTHKLIKDIGIHHVAVFETVPTGLTTKLVVLAFGCFDGSIVFYYYRNDDLETFSLIDTGKVFSDGFWSPGFYKDPESVQNLFVVTKANGSTAVYSLSLNLEDLSIEVADLIGTLNASSITSFPNSLGISLTSEALCAVGYSSGDVVVFNLKSLKQEFTFHSTDLQVEEGQGSSSIPRVVEFSPCGTLLAVSRDNQSAGSITLYDVKYGENVGSLTTLSHSAKTNIGGFAHEGWIMGLSFNEDGSLLASCGFDKCVRVWNMELREREATLVINITDLEDTTQDEEADASVCSGVAFIKKGVRGGAGGDSNEGLCVVSFDRGVRWYREAGGI
ncbi:CIC11C00000002588 [Sungouiella intermedia]|uniref:CIC11C00000002588 n=1 Tax=Sungouiella intermedia TaxID=45354 RepID=A0A1L0BXW5_9ASCO|nr:CIC11C00000002588 [[Candida] intermedia]